MTEIPIVVNTNEITVGGIVEKVELEVSTGAQGERGSRIFSGTVNPNTLPVDDPAFGGYTEFIQGDIFIQRNQNVTAIWEWRPVIGGYEWVQTVDSIEGGIGDVLGPSSSTLNALARFADTTGKLIKNSSVTVSDSGIVTASTFSGSGASLTSVPQSGVVNLVSDLALKAPLANPTFTGTVNTNNLTIGGTLVVNGTTTTVNATTVTLDDPIITLGGDTAPANDDGKDRGVEFRWHTGSAAKVGFFGFDDSTGYFTFIPDATNTSEVFSGTKGTIDAYFSGSNINAGTVSASYIDSAIARLSGPTFTGTVTIPTLDLTTAATATAATSYFVETGSDGVVRPKTLANVKTEIVTTAAVNSAAATTVGTITSGTWNAGAVTSSGNVISGGWLGTTYNSGNIRPPVGSSTNPYSIIAWNYSDGTGETNIWNTWISGGGFVFKQLTGASSHVDVLTVTYNGALSVPSTISASGLAGSLLSSVNPLMNGSVAVGTSAIPSRQDHVHPVDTSRSPVAGSSSIVTVGTVTSGTWNGSVIDGARGGTGVANTGKTITISGNTSIGSSTHTVTFATSGNTSVTLPTSGTLEVTGHTHSYLPLTGGSLSGELTFSDDGEGITFNGAGRIYKRVGSGITIKRHSGESDPHVENYAGDAWYKIWHEGNDGSGSGLDADTLDGSHASAFATSGHNHSGVYQPVDADLTAIAALAGTSGFLKKTATDTWTLDTSTYLTGNQTITLSGNVTGSGTTSITTTIANDAVTYAKMQNVSAQYRVLGRISASAGDTEELTGENLVTVLGQASSKTGTTNLVFSASPTLSGTPLSTTAAVDTNTTQIATTAFTNEQVKRRFTSLVADDWQGGGVNWNNATAAGVYPTLMHGSNPNSPGGNYWHLLNVPYSSTAGTDSIFQIAFGYGTAYRDIAIRGRYSTDAFGAWYRLADKTWVGDTYLPLAGGTLTGNLGISIPASQVLTTLTGVSTRIDRYATGTSEEHSNNMFFTASNIRRWKEAISATDWALQAFDSSGNYTSTPLQVNTTSGVSVSGSGRILNVSTSSGPYIADFYNGSSSTAQYNVVRWSQGASGSATGYIGTGGSTVGNGGFANTFVVGTQSNNDLVFNTYDTEKVRLTAAGRLGIGRNDPAYKLDVTGDIRSSATIYATTFSGSGSSLTSLPAGQLSGTIPSGVTSNITTLGTITSGTWNAGELYARLHTLYPNGEPTSNLGWPTIPEMALFDSQFNNKTWFYDPTKFTFTYTMNGTDWLTQSNSTAEIKNFVGGAGATSSNIYIPNQAQKYRIDIRNDGNYVYINALYMYYSTNSHSTKVHIWKKRDDGSWIQHTSSNTLVSSWPGHLYLPFWTIPWSTSLTGGHYNDVRIEFIPTWTTGGGYDSQNISLLNLELWGGYPSGRRTIYNWDSDKNVIFPASILLANRAGTENMYMNQGHVTLGLVSIGRSGSGYGTIGDGYRSTVSADTYTYDRGDYATQIDFASGGFKFKTAPIGSAGNTVSFTSAMSISNAGKVGIGQAPSGNYLAEINGTLRVQSQLYLSDSGNWLYAQSGNPVDIRGYHGVRFYNSTGLAARIGTSDTSLDSRFYGKVGINTAPSYKFHLWGGHSDTKMLLHSEGGGTAATEADLILWASEPNNSYDGVGIGNNVFVGESDWQRASTARGGSYVRLYGTEVRFGSMNTSGVRTEAAKIDGTGNLTVKYGVTSSNDNLMLNSSGGNHIYLNYSSGGGYTYFGNAANGTVGYVSTGGNMNLNGTITAAAFSGSGSSLTSLPAGQLSGTIPSGVLGNSSVYIGTTPISLNRGSGLLDLTDVGFEAAYKNDITTRTLSGFWQTDTPTTAGGWPEDAGWYHLITSTHSNTSNYYSMQFAADFYDVKDLFYRVTAGTGTAAWYKMWHAGNDGSGSGLDADLLDGLHLHTGRNNEANKVVRTDSNGYIQAGWINTDSGDNGTTAISRVYASQDGYIRYYSPANFISTMGIASKAYVDGDSSWTTLTLASGWSTESRTLQIRRAGTMVFVNGTVKYTGGGNPTYGTNIVTGMATTYRPSKIHYFTVGASGSYHIPTRIDVTTGGDIKYQLAYDGSTSSATTGVALDFCYSVV